MKLWNALKQTAVSVLSAILVLLAVVAYFYLFLTGRLGSLHFHFGIIIMPPLLVLSAIWVLVTCFSESRGKASTCSPWAVAAILTYEILCLVGGLVLISLTWPGNEFALAHFRQKYQLELMAEVTSDSMARLIQAGQAVAAWQAQRSAPITAASRQAMTRGLALASELTSTNSWVTNSVNTNIFPSLAFYGDPSKVTGKSLDDALSWLSIAVTLLQKRQASVETNLSARPWPKHMTELWSAPTKRIPRLAASERKDLEQRLTQKAQLEGVSCFSSRAIDLLLLLMACGAIGGATQSLSSIVNFLGNDRFKPKWGPFYIVRPITGAMLAIGLYFLVAAGYLNPQATSSPAVNSAATTAPTGPGAPGSSTNAAATSATAIPPTVQTPTQGEYASLAGPAPTSLLVCCALAMLAGLFSGEAMESFKGIAAAVFKTNRAKDALEEKHPMIVGYKVEGPQKLTKDSIVNFSGLAGVLKNLLP